VTGIYIDLTIEHAGGVYIMSGPRNATVPDGGTAQFHCDVDGFPDNISIDWLFELDDSVVASTSLAMDDDEDVHRQRYRLDADTAGLTVLNVSTEDAGLYSCTAYNGLGASASASAFLSVTCN